MQLSRKRWVIEKKEERERKLARQREKIEGKIKKISTKLLKLD